MKLVTGIEAIQSGKPFRFKDDSAYVDNDTLLHIMPKLLLEKAWVIKEEPREFWIDISMPNCVQMFSVDTFGVDFSGDNWIRVREIEK